MPNKLGHLTIFFKVVFIVCFIFSGKDSFSSEGISNSPTKSSGFVHGLSFHDLPKYDSDFQHYHFAHPLAKKGGLLRKISIGSFDCLNKTYKCTKPDGLELTQDTLMSRSLDEPFSIYGLVAKEANLAKDSSWIEFRLNPDARWHDGSPITVEDVIFSLNIQRDKGLPFVRSIYSQVKEVKKTGKDSVKFIFKKSKEGYNKELPFILAMMTLYPRKYYTDNSIEFDAPLLTPPLTSGPYKIKTVEPGRHIVYERISNYWGEKLPVNTGRYNFDEVRYDYYRDRNTAFQAFKSGHHDVYRETSYQSWKKRHKGKSYEKGLIKKIEMDNDRPVGLRAFSFNTRKPLFKDKLVRIALITAFDRNFILKSIFPNFKPNNSYFDNTDLAAPKEVAPEEIKLIKALNSSINGTKLRNHAKDAYKLSPREKTRKSLCLLKKAGWQLRNGQLRNKKTGQVFEFDILVPTQDDKKLAQEFARNMANLGIKVTVVLVDAAQYERRKQDRSYDMISTWWATSISPGNELKHYWSCSAKDNSGSRNYPGICSPLSDKLISLIPQATSRKELCTLTHTLDRFLMDEAYLIPLFFSPKVNIALTKDIHYQNSVPNPIKDYHFWWLKEPEKSPSR